MIPRENTETEREVLNWLRAAAGDLILIEEECGGSVDLKSVIEQLQRAIRKLESSH
jgi:hypothetical protein